MAVFSYFCEADHESERHIGSASERPASVACDVCAAPAAYRVSASRHQGTAPTASRTGDGESRPATAPSDGKGFVWRDVVCRDAACSHVTVEDIELVDGRLPADAPLCERCAGPTDIRDLVFNDRFSERFPYFDRGLGRVVTSKQHRLEVCRQLGVEPIDGDIDIDAWFKRRKAEDAAEDAEVATMNDMMEHSPAFRNWREKRDRERAAR